MGTLDGQAFPAVAAEHLAEAGVGGFGIGDGDLALQGRFDSHPFQDPIHGGVHAADKKGGHRCNPGDSLPRRSQLFQAGNIGLSHSIIVGQGEHEGDVDIDPLADEPLDGRDALGCGRHFDHHVGAIQGGKETPRLDYCALGVVGQPGIDLQADIAVGATGPFIDRVQDVGSALDIFQGQRFVQRPLRPTRRHHLCQGLVIVGAAGDGLFKDGRVGGDARYPRIDQRLQFSVVQQRPADVVIPDRLADFGQLV